MIVTFWLKPLKSCTTIDLSFFIFFVFKQHKNKKVYILSYQFLVDSACYYMSQLRPHLHVAKTWFSCVLATCPHQKWCFRSQTTKLLKNALQNGERNTGFCVFVWTGEIEVSQRWHHDVDLHMEIAVSHIEHAPETYEQPSNYISPRPPPLWPTEVVRSVGPRIGGIVV